MTTSPLPIEERTEILRRKIHALVKAGCILQSQTETSASLIEPAQKRSFGANLIATIFTAGLWLFVWILMVILNPFPRDKHLHVFVDTHGVVSTTTDGWMGGTIEDRTEEALKHAA